jgi:hypothetical protein
MFTKARKKFLPLWAGLSILIIVMLFAQSISPALAANDSITVNFGSASGAPTYRASGFIYGIAADGSNPPNSMLSDIKTKFLRVGGAQIGCPNGGYVNGQYAARWNAVKAYYAKAKAVGATLVLLPHDLWGADAVCTVPRWPGGGGNWTEYTTFMTQVINDAIANGMTGSDVRWDIWNEPNYPAFWGGTQSQYFEMWKRGYQAIRARIPNAKIEGPSLAGGSGGWMGAFLDYVKANNVIPDYLTWHDLPGDPVGSVNNANSLLSSRSITVSGFDINEYGGSGTTDQQPGPSGWYIARLERANADGLRANWGSGGGLYGGMGDLTTSSWQPRGAYWMYRRYADQTGLRTSVTAGSQVDGVAFQDSAALKSIILIGNKGGVTGSVNVVLNNIPSWLQNGGAMQVLVERMPTGTAYVSAPTVVSNSSMAVSNNSLTIAINWSTATDGYVITLTKGGGGGPTPTKTNTPVGSTPTAVRTNTPGPTPTTGSFPVPGTYYRLINRNSGKVAEVSNFSTADGGNVQQWTSTGTSSQQWSFVSVGSGYYNVINRNSGKCLDVNGASTTDGANVQQWTCGSGTNQRWQLIAVGSYYELKAQHSGKALDVVGNGTADGVNVDQWTWNSGNNQQWQIVP